MSDLWQGKPHGTWLFWLEDFAYEGMHPPVKLAAMVSASNSAQTNETWLTDSGDAQITSLPLAAYPKSICSAAYTFGPEIWGYFHFVPFHFKIINFTFYIWFSFLFGPLQFKIFILTFRFTIHEKWKLRTIMVNMKTKLTLKAKMIVWKVKSQNENNHKL